MPKGISKKTKRERGSDRDSVTGPKRTPDEVLRDRAEITRLHMEGKTQNEIITALGEIRDYKLSVQTIARDLKAVRAEWLNTSIENYEKTALIELARLDREESEAWNAWERSKKPIIRRKTGESAKGPIDERICDEYEDGTIAERDGNPAFLQRLESIRQRRCAILGFNSQQKSEDINAAIVALLREGYAITAPIGELET
jgi:hypothetical protein